MIQNDLNKGFYVIPKIIDEKLVELFLDYNKESIDGLDQYF